MYDDSILIVTGSKEFSDGIKAFLNSCGYFNIDTVYSGGEALRKALTSPPDVMIINYKLPDLKGIEVAQNVAEAGETNVILAVGRPYVDYAHQICDELNILILPKPISKSLLLQSVKLLFMSKQRIKRLESELGKLKKNMDDKKIVEKAKWLLVEKLEMSEPQAYRFLQKKSMDSRTSMREVAEDVLLGFEGNNLTVD